MRRTSVCVRVRVRERERLTLWTEIQTIELLSLTRDDSLDQLDCLKVIWNDDGAPDDDDDDEVMALTRLMRGGSPNSESHCSLTNY